MDDLDIRVENARNKNETAKELHEQALQLEKEVQAELSAITDRIRGGENTNDRILDLLITRGNLFNKEVEGVYREVDRCVAHKDGQNVLICGKSSERANNILTRHVAASNIIAPRSENEWRDVRLMWLGTISSEECVVDPVKDVFGIPTKVHVFMRSSGSGLLADSAEPEVVMGNMHVPHMEKMPFSFLLDWQTMKVLYVDSFVILVGDEEITNYLNRDDMQEFAQMYKEMLSKRHVLLGSFPEIKWMAGEKAS